MIRNREPAAVAAVYIAAALVTTALCAALRPAAGLVCGGGFLVAGAAFFAFTRRRYRALIRLALAVRRMAGGDELIDMRDFREGELSILKSDIYALTLRLSEQAALLRGEKAALQDILFDISHQLKTPVASLTVMADLLERDELPAEKRREFVANLQAGLSRMDWLVRSLLKLARLDAGSEVLHAGEVAAAALADLAVSHLRAVLDAKSQRVDAAIDDALMIRCDRNWTAEALINLLKNASEHTPEGGRIELTAGENPLCAWLRVADSGSGVDPADLPHLFVRFYKGKASAKESIGIGLAMSLSVMRAQNGDIEVESKPGQGAAFTMKFYR